MKRSLFPTRAAISLSALALVVAAGILAAGPLNPPAGPVTSSYKTLSEVEPRIAINATNTPGDADSLFTITASGSYYLTGNITGVAGKHGIKIAASGVTLDLGGFQVLGVSGSLSGVATTLGNLTSIAVSNGEVRGWGQSGLTLGSNVNPSGVIKDIRSINNTISGITSGRGSVVTRCVAFGNGGTGIFVSPGSTITQSVANLNGSAGISTTGLCVISGCDSLANHGDGIVAGAGTGVYNCSVRANDLNGINAGSECVITGNTCSFAGATGVGANILLSGSNNRVEGNNCCNAERGIQVNLAGNIIIRNVCADNTINWVIAANNVCGPILDRTAPASAAISGNVAPSSLGTTDANANFTY